MNSRGVISFILSVILLSNVNSKLIMNDMQNIE